MPSPSAEQRLLRGLAELEVAAGLVDPVEPAVGPGPAPSPTSTRPATQQIRRRGPLAALVLPGLLGVCALLLLAGDNSTTQGILGFGAAMLAAPLLAVAGVPLRSGSTAIVVAAIGSSALWLALGSWAARRVGDSPTPSWARFAAEYAWMVFAVWLGLAVAAVATDLVLGRPML